MNPSDATNKNAAREPRLHLAGPGDASASSEAEMSTLREGIDAGDEGIVRLLDRRARSGAGGASLRGGIDAVDEGIVRLLDRRAWLARRIGEIKHEQGLAAYAPARGGGIGRAG